MKHVKSQLVFVVESDSRFVVHLVLANLFLRIIPISILL